MSSKLQSKAHGETTIRGFLRRQFTKPKPLPPNTDLSNRTALVTGSNVGLGFEASRQLLALNLSHLIMGVRSQSKGDAAAAKLRKEFPSAKISVWIVDLASYDSVISFSAQCATLPRLDIAILNAGLVTDKFVPIPETKHETTLQVNYLSTVLLALLIIPTMTAAKRRLGTAIPTPVLSIVGSDIAAAANFSDLKPNDEILASMDNPDIYSSLPWYSKTKLLVMLFVAKLSELVDPDELIVNVSNPSMTKGTDFFRLMPWYFVPFMKLAHWSVARSAVNGAAVYVDAVVGYGTEVHGSFVSDWQITAWPTIIYKPEGNELKEKVWRETVRELKFGGAEGVVKGLEATQKK